MENEEQKNQTPEWQSLQKTSGNVFSRNKELWAIIIIVLLVAVIGFFLLKDKIITQKTLTNDEKQEILNNLNQKRPLSEGQKLEIQNRLNASNKTLSDEQVEEMAELLGN